MPKVQIEIDLPNSCGDCPFGHYDECTGWCGLVDYYKDENNVENYSKDGFPDWCHLHKKYNQDLENLKKQAEEYIRFLEDCSTLPLWNNPKANQVLSDWMQKAKKENNV